VKLRLATLAAFEVGLLWLLLYLAGLWWSLELLSESVKISTLLLRTFIAANCVFFSFYYNGLYDIRSVKNFQSFTATLPGALLVVLAGLSVLHASLAHLNLLQGGWLSLGVDLLVITSAVIALRWLFYTLLGYRLFAERVLILGTGPLAQQIAEEIEAASPPGAVVLGFVDDNERNGVPFSSRLPSGLVGSLSRLEAIIAEQQPDRIIVALRERRGRLPVQELLNAHIAGIVVEDGVCVHERLFGKLAIENLTPGMLLFSSDFKKPAGKRILRRVANMVVAFAGLMALSPLMMFIALLIKLDSRGSIFFIQKRAGLHKKNFNLIKFRTMHPAATERSAESVWNRDVGGRVTRVGRWLRKTHLDELPQLFNVIRGDMDLVGPRPEMAENIETMLKQIPYYALRMTVRPGLTGWAQVKHGYAMSQEDVTEKMRYDLYYIKNMSLWLDLRILIDTVKIVFSRQGDQTHRQARATPEDFAAQVDRLEKARRSAQA
jgi:exopolysaccharide biosynthesis polyprenyl glycosylphosphotransferase